MVAPEIRDRLERRPDCRCQARRGNINAVVNELASAENGAVVFASSTGSSIRWKIKPG